MQEFAISVNESELSDIISAIKTTHDEYCMCSDHSECDYLILTEKLEAYQ